MAPVGMSMGRSGSQRLVRQAHLELHRLLHGHRVLADVVVENEAAVA